MLYTILIVLSVIFVFLAFLFIGIFMNGKARISGYAMLKDGEYKDHFVFTYNFYYFGLIKIAIDDKYFTISFINFKIYSELIKQELIDNSKNKDNYNIDKKKIPEYKQESDVNNNKKNKNIISEQKTKTKNSKIKKGNIIQAFIVLRKKFKIIFEDVKYFSSKNKLSFIQIWNIAKKIIILKSYKIKIFYGSNDMEEMSKILAIYYGLLFNFKNLIFKPKYFVEEKKIDFNILIVVSHIKIVYTMFMLGFIALKERNFINDLIKKIKFKKED